MSSQPENEWEYDTSARVACVVGALEPRSDSVATLLHLQWAVGNLMREVKMVNLTECELVSLLAVLAPVAVRRVVNEWDYDVRERVADAAVANWDGRLPTVLDPRAEICKLMETVKLTNLTVPELAAMLAVFAPANGRRLVAATFKEALRPVLRLVNNGADLGDAALEFIEQIPDLPDELSYA
jgi:hypothetical protein